MSQHGKKLGANMNASYDALSATVDQKAADNWTLQLIYTRYPTDVVFKPKSFAELFGLCQTIEETARASGLKDDDPIISAALEAAVVQGGWDPDSFSAALNKFVRDTEAQVRDIKKKIDN